MTKINWEGIGASFLKHKTKWFIVIGAVALIVLFLFLSDWGSNWAFWRGVRKDKEVIKEKVDKLRDIDKEIEGLQGERKVVKEELIEAADNFNAAANVTDAARANTDRAQENTNQALKQLVNVANANLGNVNTSDIDKLLEQLP